MRCASLGLGRTCLRHKPEPFFMSGARYGYLSESGRSELGKTRAVRWSISFSVYRKLCTLLSAFFEANNVV